MNMEVDKTPGCSGLTLELLAVSLSVGCKHHRRALWLWGEIESEC